MNTSGPYLYLVNHSKKKMRPFLRKCRQIGTRLANEFKFPVFVDQHISTEITHNNYLINSDKMQFPPTFIIQIQHVLCTNFELVLL